MSAKRLSIPLLLQQRAQALEEAQKILTASATAARPLKADESTRVDALLDEAKELETELSAERRAEAIAAAGARPLHQAGMGDWNAEII